jgi:hypothetical protein
MNILSNSNTDLVEMTGLNFDEVRTIIRRQVRDAVTDGLVELVHKASGGSAFWCKMIAKYLVDNGVESFVRFGLSMPCILLFRSPS